jgi:hypothetical protein
MRVIGRWVPVAAVAVLVALAAGRAALPTSR